MSSTAFTFISIFLSFLLLVITPKSNAFSISELETNLNSTIPISSNFAFTRQNQLILESRTVILTGNFTISSENRTFQMGFFSPNGGSKWYLGVWYSSTPTPTYVWVANREKPVTNLGSSAVEITDSGKLAIMASESESPSSVIWESTNTDKATEFRFLDSGNLVLLSSSGSLLWQSFDYPTDTWLPGMNITKYQSLTSWRSSVDPSPGFYSLRLNPREYNEFELVYNSSIGYWRTGNWTGTTFAGVPEMGMKYIYNFHFNDPYTPAASFWYTVVPLDTSLKPPLTRFHVDSDGQLKQFTWAAQVGSWNMFWSQPEDPCKVHRLCGDLGVCKSNNDETNCFCLSGFKPISDSDWELGDYSAGCGRVDRNSCGKTDGFMVIGAVEYEGAGTMSFQGNRRVCQRSCLGNCSCIGLFHDDKTNLCKNLYGSLFNLRNFSSNGIYEDKDSLFLRVPNKKKESSESKYVLIGIIVGSIAILILSLAIGILLIMQIRRRKNKGNEKGEEKDFPMLNLKVFTYKKLYSATQGFSDKLGHGGFGAVFRGELDSTSVAVKRLERPDNGEKEFRAEVCTIGSIHHVNLVRLLGFCSEKSHRLLVYEYMPNGPLSAYLRPDGPNLTWDVRFRVAVGTARAIAYLHEGCRDCIIHCDIKPENILLDTDYTAKVSDFGLAKLVGRDFSRVLATMRGTWGYVAPEWISGVAITTKADVYSYGMTLLELLGGRRNVVRPASAGGGGDGEKIWFFPPYAAQQIIQGNVGGVVDYKLGSSYKIEEAERVALVAIWCIQDNEDMRPAMGMVVKMLEGVLQVPIPPAPKLLQALISGESYRGLQIDSGTGVLVTGDLCGDNLVVSSCGSQASPVNGNLNV
ncbi:G-type lectin S-receptor-like serine/threonine-protein kinase SD2-2 [Euphorbia lathyris]|uniref:G-type lectin S-receptor-like serine/threonine-protein kinase SD2-2 n=1 Tax=Euphorbia lathyris TaxID=212925 RepID=UPI0033140C7B